MKDVKDVKDKNSKPKYNMWQNTAFMIRLAWSSRKSVPLLCVALAVVTASVTVAQLLITPGILQKVETSAPLGELVLAIALFSGGLLILSGLKAYIEENILYGRVEVRSKIMEMIGNKVAGTSYPNTLDTEFLRLENRSTEATNDNGQATEAVWKTLTDILTNVIGFSVYLILLSGLKPWILLLVTATAAIGYFVSKLTNRWEYGHRDEQASYRKTMYYIRRTAEDRSFAKDIRIFGLGNWIEDVWHSALRLYQSYLVRREKIYLLSDLTDLILTFLRNGIAYAYLIRLTLEQDLPVSVFLLYFGAVTGFTQWITGILQQFTLLHRQSLDLSMVREFLEWPEPFLFAEGEPLEKDPQGNYEICLENVSFRYPGAASDTISHMDLTIYHGEKLAIVGLNGAGKTTLIKLICGFLAPTGGRILLNGKDIRQFNRRDYYDLFAAVFQDFSILEATVAENVAQRVEGIDRDLVRTCLYQAGLTEKMQALPQGIDTHIGHEVFEDGVELSGGQTQRLMLARALYKDAPILLLDEPTAALDPLAEQDIYNKYSEMTGGRTSLFISHRLASTRFCDRILLLQDGQIAESGTHEELLARGGGYAALFEIQSRYYQEGVKFHEE